jgi:hypothetical protein
VVVFRLSDGSSATPELLGLWHDEPAAVTFDAEQPDLQVWRADLPADVALAGTLLAVCDTRLQRSRAQLSDAAAAAERVALAEPVEFAAASRSVPRWWQEACDDLVGLAGRVSRVFSPTAVIETRVDDEMAGRSLVGLRGEVRTVWWSGCGQAEALLHQTTVTLALSTRATMVRTIAVAMSAASVIAVRLALPGGPLLALPATWRLIQRVLSERDM